MSNVLENDIFIEVIANLLSNRDFMGLQLDLAYRNVTTEEYLVLCDKYLNCEGTKNIKTKVKFLKEIFDVDAETLSVMLNCEMKEVEDVLKEEAAKKIWDFVDLQFEEGMSFEDFKREVERLEDQLNWIIEHAKNLGVDHKEFTIERFIVEEEDSDDKDWISFAIKDEDAEI